MRLKTRMTSRRRMRKLRISPRVPKEESQAMEKGGNYGQNGVLHQQERQQRGRKANIRR
jgi:hypothetical protein